MFFSKPNNEIGTYTAKCKYCGYQDNIINASYAEDSFFNVHYARSEKCAIEYEANKRLDKYLGELREKEFENKVNARFEELKKESN